ncbi:MAG: lipid A deacylase LpxR family protein [Rickettsiales bacterium]|nr:lipid A deacylase LpxR family protein [Rickettsiales bacterium]
MFIKNKKIILCIVLLVGKNVYAKDSFLQNVSLTYENDSVLQSDRYYTNGIQFSFLSKNYNDSKNNSSGNGNLFYNYSFGFGQKIFTSSDIEDPQPRLDDRPYAGYLYFYANKNFFYEDYVNLFGFSIGLTGKGSLAEATQKKIHELIGSPKPRGWDTQLKNELLFMFTYSNLKELYRMNLQNKKFNIISRFTTDLGTPYTDIKQYFEFRFGNDVFSDFSFNRIDTSTIGMLNRDTTFSYYYFTSVGANVVFYNTFLDGNLNDRRTEIDKKPIIYDINFGVNLTFNKFYIKCLTSFIGKEFKTQTKDGQVLFTITGGILF